MTDTSAGAVVSARLSAELAERLFAEAKRRRLRTSALVREAVEAYLEDAGRAASVDVTISSVDGPVTYYTGRSSVGRTLSAPANFERA